MRIESTNCGQRTSPPDDLKSIAPQARSFYSSSLFSMESSLLNFAFIGAGIALFVIVVRKVFNWIFDRSFSVETKAISNFDSTLDKFVTMIPFFKKVEKVLFFIKIDNEEKSFYIKPGEEKKVFAQAKELVAKVENPFSYKIDAFVIPKATPSKVWGDWREIRHFQQIVTFKYFNQYDTSTPPETTHKLKSDFSNPENLKLALAEYLS